MSRFNVIRYHDFCMGHTVTNHESKCANIHGHNYRVHVKVEAVPDEKELDEIGRVIDFSFIKDLFFDWIEREFDHRFLIYEKDFRCNLMKTVDPTIVVCDFNPTAENIANFFLAEFNKMLEERGRRGRKLLVTKVILEETRKCSVEVSSE